MQLLYQEYNQFLTAERDWDNFMYQGCVYRRMGAAVLPPLVVSDVTVLALVALHDASASTPAAQPGETGA
jgi:hypothetical protein